MSELLRIQTPDFELSISCSDISKRQKTFDNTIEKRKENNLTTQDNQSVIRFSPPLDITEAIFKDESLEKKAVFVFTQSGLVTALELPEPIFFENIQYQFKWLFISPEASDEKDGAVKKLNIANAYLTHRSHAINKGFEFSKSRYSMPAHLIGTINTANDVGWMRLPLIYIKSNQTYKNNIAFEVLPTKMSLHDDLPAMYKAIDSVFPLWRFSLVEKTEQDSAQNKQRNQFPLIWLANFNHLRSQLTHALKVINQAPHSRLQSHTSYNKASRLKGKLPAKLGAKVREDFANGLYEQRYQVTKKQLSVDTPENRFVKMVVSTSKKRLADFEHKLRQNNAAPDKQRLSNTFLDELHHWQQPLQKTLKQGFMTDVGAYNGRNRESLVLQQKVGYSSVYRIWQALKFYLDVFDNQSSISMKSVAEIYEVWCFLTLRNILVDELGFEEITAEKQSLKLNEFFEYQLKDGFAGAFEFKRSDGVTARLAHEPIFTKAGADIRSYLISQKPDIVLEITLPKPSNKRFIWLFDAKYRIKTIKNRYDDTDTNIDTTDYVPDDAINQMHRYRDALIRLTKDKESQDTTEFKKSRPVFGAFALYPGYFNQAITKNPYLDEINEVGIGAFALLPSPFKTDSNSNNGHQWLLSFLRQQLGNNLAINPMDNNDKNSSAVNSTAVAYQVNDYDSHTNKLTQHTHNLEESLYLQDAARIPYSGMEQVLYPDLIMTIALGGGKGRHSAYFDNFKNGLATWYHLPQSTFLGKYKQHIVNEIRYLALAITSEQKPDTKHITMLWPIKNVITLARNKITITQAGSISNSAEDYYLFELGKPLTLKDAIIRVPHRPFRNSMKLTTLNHLEQAVKFSKLKQVYDQALV